MSTIKHAMDSLNIFAHAKMGCAYSYKCPAKVISKPYELNVFPNPFSEPQRKDVAQTLGPHCKEHKVIKEWQLHSRR